jgi:hypothetical protein
MGQGSPTAADRSIALPKHEGPLDLSDRFRLEMDKPRTALKITRSPALIG